MSLSNFLPKLVVDDSKTTFNMVLYVIRRIKIDVLQKIMKTLNHLFSTQAELDEFLCNEMIAAHPGAVLLQVFNSHEDHAAIESILNAIVQQCPHIHIIGASSGGEIVNGHISHQQRVLVLACLITPELPHSSIPIILSKPPICSQNSI